MNKLAMKNYGNATNRGKVKELITSCALGITSLSETPTLDDLKSKLFAVHATDYFPVDGVLHCHADGGEGVEEKYGQGIKTPSFAPTLHFSLGELVRPHSKGSWDDNKYAILAPLGSLVPQLVNVMPYDTFTLGDINLKSNGFFVLVPDTENISENGMNIIRYNKSDGLRKAIDDFIFQHGGWNIKMNNTASIDGKAMLKDIDINNPRFFSALLNSDRKIGFGTHAFSVIGDGFRFAFISQLIHNLASNFLGFNGSRYCSLNKLKLQLSFIEWNLEKLDKYVSESGFPESAKGDYLRIWNESKKWVNLLKLEVIFREKHKISLVDYLGHNKSELQFFYTHFGDIEACETYFISRSGCNYPYIDGNSHIDGYFIWLASFEEEEFKDFLKRNSTHFLEYSEREILLNYYFFRYLEIASTNENMGAIAGLITIIETFEPALIDKYRERLWKILRKMLSVDSNKYAAVLNLLNRNEVRRLFGFSNFAGEFQSIVDIASVSPEIMKIKSKMQSLVNCNEVKILKRLGFMNGYFELAEETKHDDHRSYEDYYFSLMEIKVSVDTINRFASQMNLPINQRDNFSEGLGGNMNLYEFLYADSRGKIEELFENAGCGDIYRKKFESENEFWNSGLSLLEILENES